MTEQSISIKVKIKLHNLKDANELQQLMAAFRDGCNYVSKYIFETKYPQNQVQVDVQYPVSKLP